MNRKTSRIDIIPPFQEITNNWELVHAIESSLNHFLAHPEMFTQPNKDPTERLGKSGIEELMIISKQFAQLVEILRSEFKAVETIKANAALAQEKLQQH